jgi:hypothetical protein
MTTLTLQSHGSSAWSKRVRPGQAARQFGHGERVRSCRDVVPARLSAEAGAVERQLYWTPRGLAVALSVIAVFTIVVIATIVVQFLAVSGEMPVPVQAKSSTTKVVGASRG